MENQQPENSTFIASGPTVNPALRNFTYENVGEGIVEQDIEREVPGKDCTTLVLQANARDIRDPESPQYGEIKEEAKEKTREEAKEYFIELIKKTDPSERDQLQILVVASDSQLIVPGAEGLNSSHKRGLETATEVIAGAREALQEFGLSEEQIINSSLPAIQNRSEENTEGIGEFTQLEPTKILRESPEFIKLMVEKHGSGAEIPFWIAYEDDAEKESREKLGAEGPEEIASRIGKFARLMSRYGRLIHRNDPGKRLVIWAVSHYDSLSPFIKRDVIQMPLSQELKINKGAGIAVKFDREDHPSVNLRGVEHQIKL